MKKQRNIFFILSVVLIILYVVFLIFSNKITDIVIKDNLKTFLDLALTISISATVVLSININIDKSINTINTSYYSGSSLEDITRFIKDNNLNNGKEAIRILQNSNARKNAIYYDFKLVKKYIDITNAWLGIVLAREGVNDVDLCGFSDLFVYPVTEFYLDAPLIIDSKIRELLNDTIIVISEIFYKRTESYASDSTKLLGKITIETWGEIEVHLDKRIYPNDRTSNDDFNYSEKIKEFKAKYDLFYEYVRERKFIADTQ